MPETLQCGKVRARAVLVSALLSERIIRTREAAAGGRCVYARESAAMATTRTAARQRPKDGMLCRLARLVGAFCLYKAKGCPQILLQV